MASFEAIGMHNSATQANVFWSFATGAVAGFALLGCMWFVNAEVHTSLFVPSQLRPSVQWQAPTTAIPARHFPRGPTPLAAVAEPFHHRVTDGTQWAGQLVDIDGRRQTKPPNRTEMKKVCARVRTRTNTCIHG